MIKGIAILSLLFLFVSCRPNTAANSSATSNTPAIGKTTSATGLTGIWAKEGDDNPAFEINQDSIYYPDHAASYPYETGGDTIMIHYKGFTDTFNSQLKGNDTLVLSNKADGKHVYYRYKN